MDGDAITGPDKALELLSRVLSASVVRLDVLRAGRPLAITVVVR